MSKIRIPVKEQPEIVEVELGGQDYSCYPVKMTTITSLMGNLENVKEDPTTAAKLTNMLIKKIFVGDDQKRIVRRLQDPNDGLDFPHIMELANALVEQQTGNPTM